MCWTSTMSQRFRVAERASSARARHWTALASGLIVLLFLTGLRFIDPGAIAQEIVGQDHRRIAMDPTVLTVEPEKAKAAKAGSDFKECANGCPMMIVIPAGKFIMGSPENESDRRASESPPHEVTIAKPFAVSKFEVTFEDWDACAAAAACARVPDSWGRGQMPVINVSWNDAKQYVGWLSQLTCKDYRLLTEAEWEYAGRAGANTPFSWGDDPGIGNANCDECGSQWDRKQTAPAGSFKPNALGLYDTHGNVWEWVEMVGTRTTRVRQRTGQRGSWAAIQATVSSAVAPGATRHSTSERLSASGAILMSSSTLSACGSLER